MGKTKFALKSTVAAASCAILCLALAVTRAQDVQTSQSNSIPAAAESVAAQMVPADAVLHGSLDSRTAKPGQEFQATLTSKVHLKNGPELPKGTVLVGTIATDNMQTGGTSTLALRFTEANLKEGKSVPIVATIIGIAPPTHGFAWDQSDQSQAPMEWNGQAVKIDQVDALSGVDLHSTISGKNSGVFVSSTKTDMKLEPFSRISLAIGAQSAADANGGD